MNGLAPSKLSWLVKRSSKTIILSFKAGSASKWAKKNASASVVRSPALKVFLKLGWSSGVFALPIPIGVPFITSW